MATARFLSRKTRVPRRRTFSRRAQGKFTRAPHAGKKGEGKRSRPHGNPCLSIGTRLPTWQWQTPGITNEMLHIATRLANRISFHTFAREDASNSASPSGGRFVVRRRKRNAAVLGSLFHASERCLFSAFFRTFATFYEGLK